MEGDLGQDGVKTVFVTANRENDRGFGTRRRREGHIPSCRRAQGRIHPRGQSQSVGVSR